MRSSQNCPMWDPQQKMCLVWEILNIFCPFISRAIMSRAPLFYILLMVDFPLIPKMLCLLQDCPDGGKDLRCLGTSSKLPSSRLQMNYDIEKPNFFISIKCSHYGNIIFNSTLLFNNNQPQQRNRVLIYSCVCVSIIMASCLLKLLASLQRRVWFRPG